MRQQVQVGILQAPTSRTQKFVSGRFVVWWGRCCQALRHAAAGADSHPAGTNQNSIAGRVTKGCFNRSLGCNNVDAGWLGVWWARCCQVLPHAAAGAGWHPAGNNQQNIAGSM
jgi:hypothetical protein